MEQLTFDNAGFDLPGFVLALVISGASGAREVMQVDSNQMTTFISGPRTVLSHLNEGSTIFLPCPELDESTIAITGGKVPDDLGPPRGEDLSKEFPQFGYLVTLVENHIQITAAVHVPMGPDAPQNIGEIEPHEELDQRVKDFCDQFVKK